MPIPVISVAQMREWEQASWAAGRNAADVVDSVGRAIANRLDALAGSGQKILFLAGKGHNGDDVRAARKHLSAERGRLLLEIAHPEVGLQKFLEVKDAGFSWIVDGLFGIGLDRPLDDRWQKLIEIINDSALPIVAVDVPSGLNAETGQPEGGALRAAITLTVGAPKQGLLKVPQYVGRLEVLADVGLIPCPFESQLNWTLDSDFAHYPSPRPVESNKGTYGHLTIFAGSSGYHGAAVLATQGALRARPGLVTVFPQDTVYVPVAAQCQAAMVHAWQRGASLPKNCSAIVFGPGLAASDLPESFKDEMRRLWRETHLPVVADASALDWLDAGPVPNDAVRVITPHPGEAGRILDRSAADIQTNRIFALRELSLKFGNCIVVLKGHQTLVGRAEGKIIVNNSGNPYLAQGGSGDLLTGFLGGLLAQPALRDDPLKVVRYGVREHGAAADRLSRTQRNWTVEDLSRQLGNLA